MLDYNRLPIPVGSHTGGKSSQEWTLESPLKTFQVPFPAPFFPPLPL